MASCTGPKRIFQPNKPYIYKNNVEVKGGSFTKDELLSLKQRLGGQITDSARPYSESRKGFFRAKKIHYPVYDSLACAESAKYMQTSMQFIGYFSSQISFDTVPKKGNPNRLTVNYTVQAGNPTRIDTIRYRMQRPELQQLVLRSIDSSFLIKNKAITKQDVLAEKGRLITLFRNNGYYKFTADELKVRADTTLDVLIDIDDPLSGLKALENLSANRNNPRIKLSVDLVAPKSDSTRLTKYYINNVHIFPDFRPGDSLTSSGLQTDTLKSIRYPARRTYIHYHDYKFKNSFLARNMSLHSGEIYNQDNYYQSLNDFSRKGVWQSVNMQTKEVKDSSNKLDLIVQLIPGLKNTIEGNLEASLSNSNINSITASNLIGFSGNIGWTTRNVAKEGIQMTLKAGAGIELNTSKGTGRSNIINSNDVSLSHGTIIPKLIQPYKLFFDGLYKKAKNRSRYNYTGRQSFTNASVSYVNRINLFDLQTISVNGGANVSKSFKSNRKQTQTTFKWPNIEFTKLYHETDSFTNILNQNPFLKYSFRTALVINAVYNYRKDLTFAKYPNRILTNKINIEAPFFPFKAVFKNNNSIFNKYLRNFVKGDIEYIYTVNNPAKKQLQHVYRIFLGVGVPLNKDTTLPFFKQYFGGGSSSMRGWPVRGIGRGSQPLKPYSNISGFNDRTGDLQFETNVERRQVLFTISPNSILVRYSLFFDMGNIWNLKSSKPSGIDSTQFKFKNFYKELAADAGVGLAIDFTYFLIRFDAALRVKKPDVPENNGCQLPNANLKNLFTREGRQWRYENMNFSIGIGYPFN